MTSSRVRPVSEKSVSAIRRVAWARGGARVHYLWLPHRGLIYLMYVYGKNEAGGLTPEQKKQLREAVVQIKRSGGKETRA